MKFSFAKFKAQIANTFNTACYMQCHIVENLPAFTSFVSMFK